MNLLLSRFDDVPAEWPEREWVMMLEEIASNLGYDERDVGVVIVNDDYIQTLNNQYRGKNRPTDVITFSYLDDDPVERDDVIGEIYISHETLQKEAIDLGVNTRTMFLRIAVHGLMHVLGHVHEEETDAMRMEVKERGVLEKYLASDEIDALFQ